MKSASGTFRVFVSSTFSDMSEERDALQRRVFPRLRRLCEAKGFGFQAVDLRWGVAEEAGIDHQTMRVCAQEIARCRATELRPNFMLLLGDRYGWRPLPWAIPDGECRELERRLGAEERRLVKEWYRRDDNASPEPVHLLRARTGAWREQAAWKEVERRLHGTLKAAALAAGFDGLKWLRYEASATEQEIVQGALEDTEARAHVHGFIRTIAQRDAGRPPDAGLYIDVGDDGEPDRELAGAQERLRKTLEKELAGRIDHFECRWAGTGITRDHLDAFCEAVYARLAGVIRAEMEAVGSVTSLEREVAAHRRFGASRRAGVVGREEQLGRVSAYISGEEATSLVVRGEQGSGKSALLALAAHRVSVERPDERVIVRFIGVTPASSDGVSLLQSLCEELAGPGRAPEPEVADFVPLSRRFTERLADAASAGAVALFVDGLDQLPEEDPARRLSWLPNPLPRGVRVVMSAANDDALPALAARSEPMDIGVLTPDEGERILEGWLVGAGRTLTEDQRDCVRRGLSGRPIPLYLKFAFEMVRHWESFHPAEDLPKDLPSMARALFERLGAENAHGAMLVRRSFGLLAASRHGLSEEEVLSLLSADGDVMRDFRRRSPKSPEIGFLPPIVWSRLRMDLAEYLTERSAGAATVLSFFHRVLRETAVAVCLADAEERGRTHRALARYFRARPMTGEGPERRPAARKLGEQVYHEVHGGAVRRPSRALTDIGYVEAACRAGLLHGLIEDCRLVLSHWPGHRAFDPLACGAQEPDRREAASIDAVLKGQDDPHPDYGAGPVLAGLRRLSPDRRRAGAPEPVRGPEEPIPETALGGGPGAAALAEATKTQAEHVRRADPYENSSPVGRLEAMLAFLSAHAHLILRAPHDVAALARNHGDAGPVVEAAERWLAGAGQPWLDRDPRPPKPPTRPLCVKELNHHRSIVLSLAAGSDLGRAVSAGGWKKRDEPAEPVFDDKKGRVYHPYTFGPTDHDPRLWDLREGQLVEVLSGHSDGVVEAAMCADGTMGATASHDGMLRIWDGRIGACRASAAFVVDDPDSPYPIARSRLAFSGDGRVLATVSASTGRVDIRDASDLRIVRTLETVGADRCTCIAMTPDAKVLVGGTVRGRLRVWHVADGSLLCDIAGVSKEAMSIRVSTVGTLAMILDAEGGVSVWDVAEGRVLSRWKDGRHKRLCVALSGDGRFAVAGDTAGTIHAVDVRTGTPARSFKAHASFVTGVSLADDCRAAASTGFDGSVKVWNITSGMRARTLREAGHVIDDPDCFAWSPAMSWGVRAWDDERDDEASCLAVIDHEGQCVVRALMVRRERIRSLAVSPGGRLVAFANGDGTAGLWDIVNGRLVHTLGQYAGGHLGITEQVAFLPDGRCVLSGARDPILRLWDVKTGDCLNQYPGRDGVVWALAVSPDGRWFVCGGGDLLDVPQWEVHRFDVRSAGVIGTFAGHTERVIHVGISPDGAVFWSGSHDQTIRVWRAGGGALACYHTGDPVRSIGKRVDADLYFECAVSTGEVHSLTLRNVPVEVPIVTPAVLFVPDLAAARGQGPSEALPEGEVMPGRYLERPTVRCPWCKEWSEAPGSVIEAIRRLTAKLRPEDSPCLMLPEATWNEPSLLFPCGACGRQLRSNPFIADDRMALAGA